MVDDVVNLYNKAIDISIPTPERVIAYLGVAILTSGKQISFNCLLRAQQLVSLSNAAEWC